MAEKLQWMNSEGTVLSWTKDDGMVVALEPGHADWEVQSARSGILPYDAPPPPDPVAASRALAELSLAQTIVGLVTEGWLSELDGDKWLAGELPVIVQAMILQLPASQRFLARARALRASVVKRDNPLVNHMAASRGKTPAEIDAFFDTYKNL